jgi:hypothetical protein
MRRILSHAALTPSAPSFSATLVRRNFSSAVCLF